MRGLKPWLRRLAYAALGRRPWSKGYLDARDALVAAAVDQLRQGRAFAPEPGYGTGFDERVVEYPWFFESLPAGQLKLLDAGSTLNHAVVMDRLPLERLELTLFTLAPEANDFRGRGVAYAYGDLRQLAFADASFDCVASLSTLEHVGMDNTLLYTADASKREDSRRDYLKAVAELKRVLRPGGLFLLSLPYGREQFGGWYQQFTAAMLEELVAEFRPASQSRRFYRYGAQGWREAAQADCDDAEYFDVHAAPGQVCPDKAAAARAVACLALVKE